MLAPRQHDARSANDSAEDPSTCREIGAAIERPKIEALGNAGTTPPAIGDQMVTPLTNRHPRHRQRAGSACVMMRCKQN